MRECPKCEGSGLMELDLHEEDFMNSNAIDPLTECDMCGGTGEIPSTRADKIRCKSDVELAELLCDIQQDGAFGVDVMNYEERLAWLKEEK